MRSYDYSLPLPLSVVIMVAYYDEKPVFHLLFFLLHVSVFVPLGYEVVYSMNLPQIFLFIC